MATVPGRVEIDGEPVQWSVQVHRRDTGALLASGASSSAGLFEFTVDYLGAVNVVAFLDVGQPWAASAAVAEETRAIPRNANGHWYAAEQAGNTGAVEPNWPTDGGVIADGDVLWRDQGNTPKPLIQGPFIPVP
jgi:hypothetical protein